MKDSVRFELTVERWNAVGGVNTSKRSYLLETLLLRLREVLAHEDLAQFTVKRHGR
jgi:hypothetical protein